MNPVSKVTDWHTVQIFGVRRKDAPCVIRESAYALFADGASRLAIVHSTDGTFLPGGGVESGEMVADAISREALEECGLIVCAAHWNVRAIQFAYSEKEQTQFEKRSTFVEGIVTGSDGTLFQDDHDLDHPTGSYIYKVRDVHLLARDVGVLRAVAGMIPANQTELNPQINPIQTLVAKRESGQWRVAVFRIRQRRFTAVRNSRKH